MQFYSVIKGNIKIILPLYKSLTLVCQLNGGAFCTRLTRLVFLKFKPITYLDGEYHIRTIKKNKQIKKVLMQKPKKE